MNDAEPLERERHRLVRAGWLLGFALGGFFDGILLHQILQWHHLLSGLDRVAGDLRLQVLADGWFHALMYAFALVGLWQLARSRGALGLSGAGRALLASALLGFGLWHILDSILSHWVLGIHRIRMDVPNPLLWDLLWFALFGVLTMAGGWALRRGGGKRRGMTGALLLAAVTAAAAWQSAASPGNSGATRNVTVVLRSGTYAGALLAALPQARARVVWGNAAGDVWALALDADSTPLRLYAHGALWVGGRLLPAGCSAWLRA
jgi:uncharacterized membrane protein